MSPIVVDVPRALNLVAIILKWFSLTFLFPLGVALGVGQSPWHFLVPLVLSFGLGWLVERCTPSCEQLAVREGALVVALTWLGIAGLGALPYLIAGHLTVIDALFESMSGFTATGSTILTHISDQPPDLLFWRQFTQWLGGMGIVVLAVAVLPKLAIGGRQLLEAEAPGPQVEKLTPRIQHTARALWKVYLTLTVAETLLLWGAGLHPLTALEHAFTTLAGGGFSPFDRGLEETPALVQWIVIPFMLMGATSFALMYRGFFQNPRVFLRDQELKTYLLTYAGAVALLWLLLHPQLGDLELTLRQSAFQVASVMTTTGYATADFSLWGPAAQLLLLVLMFIGGMAGSTSGSIKVVRFMMVFKALGRELLRVVHRQAVVAVRVGQEVVTEGVLMGMITFAIFYVTTFLVGSALLLLDAQRVGWPLSVLEAASAAAATLGNVGPGFGQIGPMGSFALLPATSKGLLIVLMWAGRLELYPVLVLFTRAYWKR